MYVEPHLQVCVKQFFFKKLNGFLISFPLSFSRCTLVWHATFTGTLVATWIVAFRSTCPTTSPGALSTKILQCRFMEYLFSCCWVLHLTKKVYGQMLAFNSSARHLTKLQQFFLPRLLNALFFLARQYAVDAASRPQCHTRRSKHPGRGGGRLKPPPFRSCETPLGLSL